MSENTLTIDRRQREALHGLLLQRLTGISDAGLMIQQGDFMAAGRYGNEFAADVRLLNDLGWEPTDARETFAVTIPADDLAETLWRLRVDAEQGAEEPEEVVRGRDEDAEILIQYTRAREVCSVLIDHLDRSGTDALRRAISAGLLEALGPVASREDFGQRLIALGFVNRSDAPLQQEPASAGYRREPQPADHWPAESAHPKAR